MEFKKRQAEIGEQVGVNCVYVTFRSEEGAARLLRAYQMGTFKQNLLMCCFRNNIQNKLFYEHFLRVDKAIDPTLIMWQNLGYSKASRRFRTAFMWLVSVLLILGTMYVVMQQALLNKSINQISPQIDCVSQTPSLYTAEAAFEDKQLGKDGKGILYCYCKETMFSLLSKGGNALSEYQMIFDGSESICSNFVSRYFLSNFLTFGVAIAIVALNWVAKTILRVLSSFEKFQTKSEEML